MKHLGLEAWLDFERGVVPHEQAEEMRRHLESGCGKCRKMADMWRASLRAARDERAYTPDERAVRMARSHFAMLSLLSPELLREGSFAQLVFDSRLQPSPAGIRSVRASARHLYHRAGQIGIDLRLESKPGSAQVHLIGQVLHYNQSPTDMSGARVTLLRVALASGTEEVAETSTNRSGEFQIDFQQSRAKGEWYAVCVNLEPGHPILVALPVEEA